MIDPPGIFWLRTGFPTRFPTIFQLDFQLEIHQHSETEINEIQLVILLVKQLHKLNQHFEHPEAHSAP